MDMTCLPPAAIKGRLRNMNMVHDARLRRATWEMKLDFEHDVFLELDAFDPKWRSHYPTMKAACAAAGCEDLRQDWIASDTGARIAEALRNVPDYIGDAARERELATHTVDALPYQLADDEEHEE
jgi:hypothetical protein